MPLDAKVIAEFQREKEFFRKLCSSETAWENRLRKRRIIEREFRKFTGRVWILGDLHIPYTAWNLIRKFILPEIKHSKARNKMVILPGDTFNSDLWSHFRKEVGFTASPKYEIQEGQIFFNLLTEIANHILMLTSNHDQRVFKFIQDNIHGTQEQEEVIKFLKHFDEFFSIPGLYIVNDWLVQIGDVIISHGRPSSRGVKGRT